MLGDQEKCQRPRLDSLVMAVDPKPRPVVVSGAYSCLGGISELLRVTLAKGSEQA